MKKFLCTSFVFLFVVAALFSLSPWPACAKELPKLITFTSYPVGSLGYTITSGFREAVEKLTPMKVRVEPYDNDVARVLPLKTKESELSILTGATGTCASYGMAEFDQKEWGPQPLRQVWTGLPLYLSMLVRGDSGIKLPKDLKGKRLPKVPGWPAGMLSIEAIMAYANLTWKDVQAIPLGGYVDQLKGVIQGTIDACWAATVTPTVQELDSGPHKAAWVAVPHADKEGWKRAQAVAPWLVPAVCKKAPGIAEGQSVEMTGYPYSIWAYESASPDVVYEVVKAMHKGFDLYKDMHKAMPAWNIKGAVTNPSPVPYHDGAIRYFKEAGVWTPELDQWQAEQLKNLNARMAAAKKK